jgi:hypothetical protein
MGVVIGFAMAERDRAGLAALDFGPPTPRPRSRLRLVHPLARHRHLVEGAGGHYTGAVSGDHQPRRTRTTSERLISAALGATPRQIFFQVSLPSAVPFILAGLKLGRLIGVMVAEFSSRAGLGRLIAGRLQCQSCSPASWCSRSRTTAGFGWLENRLVPWTKLAHVQASNRFRSAMRKRKPGRIPIDQCAWDHGAKLKALSRKALTSSSPRRLAVGGYCGGRPSGAANHLPAYVAGLERATSGEVLLDGRAVRPRRRPWIVFQNGSLPWRTVFASAIIDARSRAASGGRAAANDGALIGPRLRTTIVSSPAACASVNRRAPAIERKSC